MRRSVPLLLAAVTAAAILIYLGRGTAQDKAAPPADGPEAAVRKLAAEYAKAFNARDAKAVAAFWTEDGESTGIDGETVRGRAAIEADMAELFKTHPKLSVEGSIATVRPIARGTVIVEGGLKTRETEADDPVETRFSALFVRDGEEWKLASVREWEAESADDVKLADLAWLAGDWTAKGDGGEVKLTYTLDENKAFLRGTYTLTKDGKVMASGLHLITRDPAGGLRAWVFDSSGSFGEAAWTKDGTRWLADSTGTLPDGTEVTAVNVIVPGGPDAFTWQPTGRTAAGVDLPDQPPVKVTRVGKAK